MQDEIAAKQCWLLFRAGQHLCLRKPSARLVELGLKAKSKG
jgi:hypothetical protein